MLIVWHDFTVWFEYEIHLLKCLNSFTDCFFSGSCNGVGTFADNMTDCCAMPGARRYRDPITMMCERCPGMYAICVI